MGSENHWGIVQTKYQPVRRSGQSVISPFPKTAIQFYLPEVLIVHSRIKKAAAVIYNSAAGFIFILNNNITNGPACQQD